MYFVVGRVGAGAAGTRIFGLVIVGKAVLGACERGGRERLTERDPDVLLHAL